MRIPAAVFFLLIIISCNRNVVQLDYTNAKDEVPQLGNLVFRFNKSLVTDSMLNEWDSTPYIRFKPSIPGKFRWEQHDQLVFSPARPLAPATRFTAEISGEIFAGSEFTDLEQHEPIKFHTAPLRMEDVHVTWVAGDRNLKPYPRVDLFFNYRLPPATIKEKLQIKVEGKAVSYNILTISDDSRISVALQGLQLKDTDLAGEITIGKGLMPKGGTTGTEEQIKSEYNIPSPFNLVVNEVNSQHDGSAGIVNVSTSQQVAAGNIASSISFYPAVKFAVENTDEGFRVKSEQFDPEESYVMTLRKGIRGNVGGVLQEDYSRNVAFGELEPSIAFATNKGVYLSAKGNRMLEVAIVNVPRVKVIVSKIYESNLLAARTYGYQPRENAAGNEYDEDEYSYGNSASFSVGDIIYQKEIETSTLPKLGNGRLFQFSPDDKLSDLKGIYHIVVRSSENYWIRDSRFISLTDIGLVAREGRDKLYVFANSLKSAEPQQGVNVVAYGNNNQVLGIAVTNDDGVAEVAYTRKEFAGMGSAMVVAKTETDFTYMPLTSSGVNTTRFDIGGKRINNTALDAFIYSERDIYRPGERINFSVIVRDPAWNIPAQVPLKFRLLYPNGKEFRVFRKSLNEQGSTEGQIDIPLSSITGTYTLEAYSSNEILLASSNINVEEFVPDRLKVGASLGKPVLIPGKSVTLNINAVNFFGPPAAGRNYELEVQVKPKHFSPKKFASYNFAIHNRGISLDKVVRTGKLNVHGNSTELYDVPSLFSNQGLLQADFYTTVFDETGRPVSKLVSADVITQAIFLGIKNDDYWYYALNRPVKFPLIALDRNEKILNAAKAEIRVIKHEYRTVLSKAGRYFRYESQESDKEVARQIITVAGDATSYEFVPRSPGNYEIRLFVPGSETYVSRSFYSYGSWGGDANSFEVNADGNIDIETDKSVYAPGDKAKILFKAPFNGRMLVTVEQDRVLSYQYVNVSSRNASIELPLTQLHLPNAYITATLIKPHGASDIPLTVAHGFQRLNIEEKRRRNEVEIIAAKTMRSDRSQEVTVKARPGSYITLAAVDNGVLQVTDFKTPDPFRFFYADRALQVKPYDMYPQLYPEVRARLSSTGGDAEVEMEKRVNPMPAKRIRIVSYWSGVVRANGNGIVKLNVPIPKFSGQVRLMAVAYKDETFGAAESLMTVADPVVISTGLPRFLSLGDSVDMPVTITNTLSRSSSAKLSIHVTGPVVVSGPSGTNLSLPANGETRTVFRIAAGNKVDTSRINVVVEASGEKFTESIAIGIRPSAPLQKAFSTGQITAGKVLKPAIASTAYLPGTEKYTVVLSRSPVMQVAEQLRYLVQYPYGCTEQVISAAFPQLYYGDLSAVISGKTGRQENANRNVIEAIRTIKLHQLYNGALTLWDGEGEAHWWTTIYATHFLIEAKKAGFEVDASLLNTLLGYINSRLRNRATINYHYNRTENKKISPKEVAYSLYVLALAGKPNVSAMNYYKSNVALLSLDSRYLLSCAYAIAGDKRSFAELTPPAFTGEQSVPQTGGSFYSYIRDEAIALNALLEVDPSNGQIPLMAKHVAQELKKRRWYSTQECAFSFLALGKLARSTGSSIATAEIRKAGKIVAKFDGKELRYDVQGNLADLEIVAKGKGSLYYYIEAEGISASGEYVEEDSYLAVRKKFFDRDGKPLGNTFSRNDLVIVQVTLENKFNTRVENVVITDMLPAGFEIENPRTRELPGMNWIMDASTPLHLDVRDDRINLFVDLGAGRQVYYYSVRAVTPGTYRMGPVAADAMYNGEYHSYNGAGIVKIND
jgi:uncharacterized protein YfaS (alpha-2-macroglobulin family)